jgi:protein arginine kinase activator
MDGRLMTCQHCQDEATVHLTETVEGRRRELHLCLACAREAGLALPEEPPALALDAVIQGLIVANVGELAGELAGLTCPDCGLKFMEFRARGRLGCPHDYRVFARGLLPLLGRAHGATRHVGKVARRRPTATATAGDRLRLRARLRDAIAREDYELAARLRDQLRHKDADA